MPTLDADGRERRAVYLPRECWDWLHERAGLDDSSVSDLLEGLVLLAKDRDAHVERGRSAALGHAAVRGP